MSIESINKVSADSTYGTSAQQAATAEQISTSDTTDQAEKVASLSNGVDMDATAKNLQSGVTADKNEEATSLSDVKDISKIINQNTVAEFGYNEPTKRITIKIKDKETDEVIKEIPSEKALKMLAKAWELAGILVDEKR